MYKKSIETLEIKKIDNEEESALRDLYLSQTMKISGLTFVFDRGLSFKALLISQAPRVQTYLWKDVESKSIKAMVSFASGPRFVFGREEEVCFLSDFRTNLSEDEQIDWNPLVEATIKDFCESHSGSHLPKYFVTTVTKSNIKVINDLFDKEQNLDFSEVANFNKINIFSRLWKSRFFEEYEVSYATLDDEIHLRQFVNKQESKKLFGYVFNFEEKDEWNHRQTFWPNFYLQKYLLVKRRNKIIGCCLPWSPPSAIKTMKCVSCSFVLKFFLNLLKIIGFSVPSLKNEVKTLYLTNLNIVHDENAGNVLSALTDFIIKNKINSGYQIISFTSNWELKSIKNFLRSTWNQVVPMGVYTLKTVKYGKHIEYTDKHTYEYDFYERDKNDSGVTVELSTS